MTGAATSSARYTEQRALHAGDSDHHLEAADPLDLLEQAPEPCDTDVCDDRRGVAPEGEGAQSFAGHRQIRGAGRNDADPAFDRRFANLVRSTENGGRGQRIVVEQIGNIRRQCGERGGAEAGEEQFPVFCLRGGNDRGDLLGRFPLAEDRLRHAGAALAIPIHPEVHRYAPLTNIAPRR